MSVFATKRELKRLEDKIKRLTPLQTKGILTSQTTQGVLRRPLADGAQTQSTSQSIIPRWG